MKKLNKYIAVALLGSATAAGLTSCNLDEYNPSSQDADAVLVTQAGMEKLVNQMYYFFRAKLYGREDPVLWIEGNSDLWQNQGGNYEYGKQMTRFVNLQGDKTPNIWNRLYDNVNNANAIINRIDDVADASEAEKNSYEGEARFMRSYCYWWLVEFFGDVELRTKETTEANFTAQRTDRKTIYDEVIIPDARIAAEKLPKEPLNGDVGRSTKKAAKALLARVLLARAQYETEGSAEQKAFYQQALDASLDVINNKSSLGIKLYNTYDEIWQAKNNKSNTEFLWVVSFSALGSPNYNTDGNPNRLHAYFSPGILKNMGLTASATDFDKFKENSLLMPTYYFMNLWKDWDARYDADFQEVFNNTGSKYGYKFTSAVAGTFNREDLTDKKVALGDTLCYFTKKHIDDETSKGYIVVDIDQLYDTGNVNAMGGARVRNPNTDATNYDASTTSAIASSYPRFIKYRVWDGDPNGTILMMNQDASSKATYADVPVMRYSEMPLIAAECYIALGNPSKAAEIINSEIRTARVVKEGHDLSEAQVSASDMTIDWIMEERARELCGEHIRWFDLKRVYGPRGTFAQTFTGRNPSMILDDCAQEFHKLRPIPTTFLDKLTNAVEFGQNEGYNAYKK